MLLLGAMQAGLRASPTAVGTVTPLSASSAPTSGPSDRGQVPTLWSAPPTEHPHPRRLLAVRGGAVTPAGEWGGVAGCQGGRRG